MALFGIKTKKDEQKQKKVPAKNLKPTAMKSVKTAVDDPSSRPAASSIGTGVIIRPRITEKSGLLSQGGVYTFEVAESATKASVAHAISSLYKVSPVKVAMIRLPAKSIFVKGRRGTVAAIRKALVTLKKGDKIDFV